MIPLAGSSHGLAGIPPLGGDAPSSLLSAFLEIWKLAQSRHQQPSTDQARRALEESAALILMGIGVSGSPPDPADSAESLGTSGLGQGWQSGAISRTTFRGLVNIMLLDLPADLRRQLGELLVNSAQEVDTAQARHDRIRELAAMEHSKLNAFPNRPLVAINLQAPLRTITEAMEAVVRHWKEEIGIPERRRRDDKLEDYLAVWDLREGWKKDHYDSNKERTLRQIAAELSIPQSTAANRYRSAFYSIIGKEYSLERWARTLGFLKVCDWVDPNDLPRQTLRRLRTTPQRRPVVESVLQPGAPGREPLLNVVGVTSEEVSLVDLLHDIYDLIDQGKSNDMIIEALELSSPSSHELLDNLRSRHKDKL